LEGELAGGIPQNHLRLREAKDLAHLRQIGPGTERGKSRKMVADKDIPGGVLLGRTSRQQHAGKGQRHDERATHNQEGLTAKHAAN
jgi:hypothetical protein